MTGMRMRIRACFFIAAFLSLAAVIGAQPPSREQVLELLEKDGCVTVSAGKVKVCKYDYRFNSNMMEAISFRPAGRGPFPGLLLVPGYQSSAKTYVTLGTILAQEGFACVAIAQPGFGGSQGKPDFVGPDTVKALMAGYKKFRREPYVDPKKLGIFGYSRGATAAALLAVQLKDVRAAALGGGLYDFKKAYAEITIEGIRENMKAEAGLTEEAARARSPILYVDKLKCPLLILHGEKDENAPVSQALHLRDRLTELRKDFEIKLFPNHKHGFLGGEFLSAVIDFFSRRLKGVPGRDLKFF